MRKIAVIGGGLSGLCAAWLLGRKEHKVTLFERQAQPGFTASSVAVPWGGESHRVDVPLRVFYAGYYPTLTRLYAALGVATEPVSYATTFTGADGMPYFRYRNLRWGDRSWAYLGPRDLLQASAWQIGIEILRFNRLAKAALQRGDLAGLTIGEFVAAARLSPRFVDGFLLPAIATIGTCPYALAREFPAAVIVDYLARGLSRQTVRRASNGADDVAAKLLAGIVDLRCNAQIASVSRVETGVLIASADGSEAIFDHVVLATQANQARRLLADVSPDEARTLESFSYTPVEVLVHRDPALMPKRRRDWSPVNLMVMRAPRPAAAGRPPRGSSKVAEPHWLEMANDQTDWQAGAHLQAQPESTIWVNAVQPALRGAPDIFQTVQPLRVPREELVIGRARFERPVVDRHSAAALLALQRLHAEPQRRVWFSGAYAQAGVPLLESAVRSAHDVAAALGVKLPA